ncbi:MAG: VWA domain-containing protein [Synoicihabitans sp.]
MSEHRMSPDDPRLTAYALGELNAAEAAEVIAAIERDPALRAEVDAIRAMSGELESVLAAEPLPETEPVPLAEQIEFPMNKRAPKSFPYFWVSGLAAAGFAVLIMVQSPESPLVGTEHYSTPLPEITQSVHYSPEPASDFNRVPESAAIELPAAPIESTTVAEQPILSSDGVIAAAKERARDMTDSRFAPAEVLSQPLLIDGGAVDAKNSISAITMETSADAPVVESEFANTMFIPDDATMGGTLVLSGGNKYTETSEELPEAVRMNNSLSASVTQPMVVSNELKQGVGSLQFAGTASMNSPPVAEARLQTALRDQGMAIRIRPTAFRRIISPEMPSGEEYARIEEQGWKRVADEPLSTFAVDVDSASFANVRRFLKRGEVPPKDAVKVEELINAFTYNYVAPDYADDAPLRANLEVAASPWAADHRLVRVGLKAQEMPTSARAAANLVFLLDVSGSMNSAQKLPLVQEAMRLLLGQLRSDDRVAIVTYAGSSGLALPSTPVSQRRKIEAALNDLRSGGSTNGAMGIHLAYDIAKANFVEGGVNRVILCTDGDFNVGTTGLDELGELISAKAQSDVFLTALGFGMGNYQDDTLERLANRGNGHHGYIDSVREARRLLVEQVEGTLNTIARDVKVQVEFNPAQVAAYRLIGYDNRRLSAQEFNDDTVDAGEIGAGHTVTALYEVIPVGIETAVNDSSVDPLRYQSPAPMASPEPIAVKNTNELLNVKVRAQPPEGGASRKWEFPLVDQGRAFAQASPDFKFAAAVAGFGLVLRDHPSVESTSLAQVQGWARAGMVTDPGGYRLEFIELVERADEIRGE